MSDRALIHYQPLTGPVWSEPVAARLAWLPKGSPAARPLERRSLGDSVLPPFYELYRPELLGWTQPATYPPRGTLRGSPDLTVIPLQFSAPAFDPQHLEWIPSGTTARSSVEVRKPSDLVGPAFDALYKPEGMQWLFEGQLSVRGIQYALQGLWVVDPNPIVVAPFDPQFFPFQSTESALTHNAVITVQSLYVTPPLPPGPDVIPPVDAGGGGGSSAVHPRRIVYERGDKRKPRTFIDQIGEPFVLLEETAEPVPDAASAGPPPDHSAVSAALTSRVPFAPVSKPPLIVFPSEEGDDDEDILLLS